jgi:hypothetical protein
VLLAAIPATAHCSWFRFWHVVTHNLGHTWPVPASTAGHEHKFRQEGTLV